MFEERFGAGNLAYKADLHIQVKLGIHRHFHICQTIKNEVQES